MRLSKWMNNLTLHQQFMLTSIVILICTAMATLLTWLISFAVLVTDNSMFRPANYYEKQLPAIFAYVDQQKEQLLHPSARQELEKVIPVEGMDYQVLGKAAQVLYGTMEQGTVHHFAELAKKINTSQVQAGTIIRYYPIIDSRQQLAGAIVLRYRINFLAANPNHQLPAQLFILGNLAAPFIYLAIFTFLFGRKLGRRVERPISALIEGTRRIGQQDLDFTIAPVVGAKELTQLGTAFEQMRRELHASLVREWRSEQERRDMVAAMAHDLRTPLTIIQGHVENLMDGGMYNPQRLVRYLHTIQQHIQRSIRLMEEMAELSTIDQPDFVLLPSNVDIAAFVTQKKHDYAMICEQKRITFHCTYEDFRDKPEPMRLDARRLERILDNLIANSVRFTPEDGRIEWFTLVREHQVEMTIRDTGPGFTEKDLRHLFQRFYQGDPSRSAEKGHSGLGLYIARTLIRKHGGEIEAGNHPESGAWIRFWIRALS